MKTMNLTTVQRREWKERLVSRLRAEDATSLSDAELERCLRPCVSGRRCVDVAKSLRTDGTLTITDLDAPLSRNLNGPELRKAGYSPVGERDAMNDKDLMATVKEFRDGMLEGGSSEFMCRAVCLPLLGYFSFLGVELEAIECDVDCGDYGVYHTCLRLPDGRILDPTADQFPLGLPPVYLGAMPPQYTFLKRLE